jgi:hypothetical protein
MVELTRSEMGMLLRVLVERRDNSVDPEDPSCLTRHLRSSAKSCSPL